MLNPFKPPTPEQSRKFLDSIQPKGRGAVSSTIDGVRKSIEGVLRLTAFPLVATLGTVSAAANLAGNVAGVVPTSLFAVGRIVNATNHQIDETIGKIPDLGKGMFSGHSSGGDHGSHEGGDSHGH
jgi:hypothetical protein